MKSILTSYLQTISIRHSLLTLFLCLVLFVINPCLLSVIDIVLSIFFVVLYYVDDYDSNHKRQYAYYIFCGYNMFIYGLDNMAVLLPIVLIIFQSLKNRIYYRLKVETSSYVSFIIFIIPMMFFLRINVFDNINTVKNALISDAFLSYGIASIIDIIIETSVANQAITKIDNYDSFFDALTGILNRKILEDWKYNKNASAVTYLDIDFFKKINDTYGHDAGDYILCQFTKVMKRYVGKKATLIREGGEEFVLVSYGLDYDFFTNITNAMDYFRGNYFEYNDNKIHFTVSVGVAFNDGSIELEKLIKMADQQVYNAKEHGRNCLYLNNREVY